MAHVNPIQIQKFLKGVDYPASKQALIDNAKNLGADENICASLEQLPDEDFQTPADVSQAFGETGDSGEGEIEGERERESAGSPRMADQRERSASGSGGTEFLAQAVEDSMAEVELCKLALQQSENDALKIFAQLMIDEHSEMGAEMERLAKRKKLDLPKDLDSKHQSVMQEIDKLSGADFDRQFMQHNVKEHENDIKVFQHYAQQESDADIKKLAEKGARMLEKHLQMARDLQKQLSA